MISALILLIAVVVTMAAAMKMASDHPEARSKPLLMGAIFVVGWFLGLSLCIPAVAILIFHDWQGFLESAVYEQWAGALSIVFGGAFGYALWTRARHT